MSGVVPERRNVAGLSDKSERLVAFKNIVYVDQRRTGAIGHDRIENGPDVADLGIVDRNLRKKLLPQGQLKTAGRVLGRVRRVVRGCTTAGVANAAGVDRAVVHRRSRTRSTDGRSGCRPRALGNQPKQLRLRWWLSGLLLASIGNGSYQTDVLRRSDPIQERQCVWLPSTS